jgi:hypothetical protein
MAPFAAFFTRPTWHNLLTLIAGAILSPGRRTVAAALSVMGLRESACFTNFHRVLNRNRWSPRALAQRLLAVLVASFVSQGPVVIGIDETIERRWGAKITARGIYRDPVRSSRGHFVKASGLRWVSLMLLVPIPWAQRVWALPFITALAPSARWATARHRRHKTLTDWARQLLLQVARWLPDRQVIAVADSTYAVIELLAAVRHRLAVITRLRLDARLFDPPSPRRPGRRGRPPLKGARQPTLAQRLADSATPWQRVTVTGWYGRSARRLDILSGTALWHHPGRPLLPIRYVLVRDVAGELDPQGFLCTNCDADPLDILRWFVRRWSMEVTFAEVRRHLGVETQRQWTDLAIARTTPALLGLFSLVTLWADHVLSAHPAHRRIASWYPKPEPTFSDALAAVRRTLWRDSLFQTSPPLRDMHQSHAALLNRLIELACYPA